MQLNNTQKIIYLLKNGIALVMYIGYLIYLLQIYLRCVNEKEKLLDDINGFITNKIIYA